MTAALSAPFPYFGGKSLVAGHVWDALGGDIRNYVEPFAGSLAVMLARTAPFSGPETVNDLSCHLVNAWRAIRADPAGLADLCVAPVSEVNTEAQHNALVRAAPRLRDLLGDPEAFDLKLAAWWVKGACEWIGSGWCSGEGPWSWDRATGWSACNGGGTSRKLPHFGDAGKGVTRKLPHLCDAGTGVNSSSGRTDRSAGRGERAYRVEWLTGWLSALSDRLASVRIACGPWDRILGPSCTFKHGVTGVFLDPPYDGTEYVYSDGTAPVSASVREWCAASGANPLMRIVLCGRAHEHDALLSHGWSRHEWTARKGYANDGGNATETLWLSPACVRPGSRAVQAVLL